MASALLTDAVPQLGLHACEVLAGGVDGCTVRVHFDCCAVARTPEVTLAAEDLSSLDAARRALEAALPLPPRHAVQQPWAMFSPGGERLCTTDHLRLVGSVFLIIEGGQFVRPGVRIGHRQTVDLGPDGTVEMETLSLTPLVFAVDNFTSPEECTQVIDVARSKMFNSPVAKMDADVGKDDSNWRTSKQTWLSGVETAALTERVARLVAIPPTHQEPLQVLQYVNGQKYDTHLDAFDPAFYQTNAAMLKSIDQGYRNRMATAFWYMTDVEAGGETIFPRSGGGAHPRVNDVEVLQRERVGLLCTPRQGKMIVFYNLLPNGAIDHMSLHGGCPVLEGEKWAANKWIWNSPKIM